MCGIAGVLYADPVTSRDIGERLNDCQFHRGPDRQVWHGDAWFGLGHTRLAINAIGPEGDQPMRSPDGRWLVSFNGEIYNHLEIRDRHGWANLPPGDGEVIPALLADLGPEGLAQLRGMFALCAVDLWERSVLLAVDPLGIKPLYWARRDGALIVASESRPIAQELPSTTVDLAAVATFLHRGAMDNAVSGISEIHRVRPGTWLSLNDRGIAAEGRTFDLQMAALDGGELTWADVAGEFAGSVRAHLMSDVPVSLLMSDGVDSGAMALELSRQGAQVTAVTVALGGGRRSEIDGAISLCRSLGIPHQMVTATPTPEFFEGFFNAMQRPTIDGLNTYIVCTAVADAGFRVALSGIGGDELLTGYTSDRRLMASRALHYLPAQLAPLALSAATRGASLARSRARLASMPGGRFPSDAADYVSLERQVWSAAEAATLAGAQPSTWTPNLFMEFAARPSRQNGASLAQVGLYQSSQLLPDTDAFSMAKSVEIRVPFVDVRFAQSVLSLESRRLTKADFVNSLGSPLLNETLARRKQGFSLPMAEWLQSGVMSGPWQTLASVQAPVRDLVGSHRVDQTMADWSTWHRGWPRMWSLMVLNEWLDRLLSKETGGRSPGVH